MLGALQECLMEMQPYGSFPMWSLQLDGIEQPVREIKALTSVYPRGLMDGPVGGVYGVTFLDGATREVFIWGNPLERDYESAVFLKPGRSSDKIQEVRSLLITDVADSVPATLIERIRRYDEIRDPAPAASLRHG